jgi:hypothetical protein
LKNQKNRAHSAGSASANGPDTAGPAHRPIQATRGWRGAGDTRGAHGHHGRRGAQRLTDGRTGGGLHIEHHSGMDDPLGKVVGIGAHCVELLTVGWRRLAGKALPLVAVDGPGRLLQLSEVGGVPLDDSAEEGARWAVVVAAIRGRRWW